MGKTVSFLLALALQTTLQVVAIAAAWAESPRVLSEQKVVLDDKQALASVSVGFDRDGKPALVYDHLPDNLLPCPQVSSKSSPWREMVLAQPFVAMQYCPSARSLGSAASWLVGVSDTGKVSWKLELSNPDTSKWNNLMGASVQGLIVSEANRHMLVIDPANGNTVYSADDVPFYWNALWLPARHSLIGVREVTDASRTRIEELDLRTLKARTIAELSDRILFLRIAPSVEQMAYDQEHDRLVVIRKLSSRLGHHLDLTVLSLQTGSILYTQRLANYGSAKVALGPQGRLAMYLVRVPMAKDGSAPVRLLREYQL
ncbi:MAG: hypothetical protein K1X79_09310 [Oligoflexia bacterium]|nr:hypothetical protein [Oligoflexia bacterium]